MDEVREPLRKRHRPSADADDSDDSGESRPEGCDERPRLRRSRRLSCLSPAPVDSPCRRTPGEDTLGSLLSPAEALARRRRTPASGGGGKKRLSRTPENCAEQRTERRAQKAQELANTESNYVRILDVIVNVAQREVSDLLPPKVVELIFSGLGPIYQLHCGIERDLRDLASNWRHEATVGRVFASRAEQLSQLYPPFVNFFDQVKEEIGKWEKRNPRFKSYLRQCQGRRECLRQSLPELLIRPVQRLPSVKLILADLLKYTTEDNPDHEWLQQALATVKQALEHINEEKRNTDLHVALFDVMNDIENFPPFLLSSHRCIVDQVDAVEIGGSGVDALCRPGATLSLFLLTDYLLISKKRAGSLPSKSPKASSLRTPVKQYRHVELLPLNSFVAVYDVVASDDDDPDDRRRLFGIQCRQEADEHPWVFCFALADETRAKASLLRQVCQQIGKVTCCANPADYLLQIGVADLGLDLTGLFDKQNQLSVKTKRFGKRVTRVLSNRTPRRTLSRALSHLQDPISFPGSPVLGAAVGDTESTLSAAATQLQQQSASAEEPPEFASANSAEAAEFKKPDRRAKLRPSLASSVKRGLESLRHSVAPPKKRSLEATMHRSQATSSSLSLWRKQQRGSEMDRSTSSLASLSDQEQTRSYEMSTRPSTTTLANPEQSSGVIQHSSSRLSIGGSSAKRIKKHLSSWSLFKGK